MSEGAASFPAERWVDALVARAWLLSPVLVALASASLAEIEIERSISVDEAETIRTVTGSWGELWEAGRSADPTSLVTWALWKPWLSFAGTSEAAARAPALVFGALACAALVLVGAQLFGRTVGTLAGALLATNGFLIAWSQTVSGLTLGLFLAVCATWALLRAVDGDTRRRWAGYVVCMTLAVLASLAAFPVAVAHVAYVALFGSRDRWVRPAVAVSALAVTLSAFGALVLTSAAGDVDRLDPPTLGTVADAVWNALGGNPAVALAAAGGIVVLARQDPATGARARLALLGAWLGAPLVLALLASIAWTPLAAEGLIAIAPAAALLASAAVTAQRLVALETTLRSKPSDREARATTATSISGACRDDITGSTLRQAPLSVAIAAGVVLAVAAGVTLAAEIRNPVPADWRAAARHLDESRSGAESVVVSPASSAPALEHSLPGIDLAHQAAGEGVWLLLHDASAGDALAMGRAIVGAPAYALLERRHFGDELEVQHWVRP